MPGISNLTSMIGSHSSTSQRGQSAVLYALLLPIAILAVGMVVDLGSMLYRYSIGQTVVAGAAYAAATAFDEAAFYEDNTVQLNQGGWSQGTIACDRARNHMTNNTRDGEPLVTMTGCQVVGNRVTVSGFIAAPLTFLDALGLGGRSFAFTAIAEFQAGITAPNQ